MTRPHRNTHAPAVKPRGVTALDMKHMAAAGRCCVCGGYGAHGIRPDYEGEPNTGWFCVRHYAALDPAFADYWRRLQGWPPYSREQSNDWRAANGYPPLPERTA